MTENQKKLNIITVVNNVIMFLCSVVNILVATGVVEKIFWKINLIVALLTSVIINVIRNKLTSGENAEKQVIITKTSKYITICFVVFWLITFFISID